MVESIHQSVKCLLSGGIVLLPTDTVYGLAVSPTFPQAIDNLYKLKSRPRRLNLPIMIATEGDLLPLGIDLNDPAKQLFASPFVPGALTLAIGFKEAGPLVPWLAGREEVAVRIPDDERLLVILKKTGPLLVTSANKHGSPSTPPYVKEILLELNGKPDYIIDQGPIKNIPSTLVNCRLTPPVVEREGRISKADLEKYLGKVL